MWTALCHAVICSLVGAFVSAAAGVVWQLTIDLTADGQVSIDPLPLAGTTLLGATLSGLIASVLSLIYQARLHRLQPPAPAPPPPTPSPAPENLLLVQRLHRDIDDARHKLRTLNADLSRLKESYRDLYHNAPVMYFSLDGEGRFVTFNDTLRRTLGYRRKELARQSYRELFGGEVKGKQPPYAAGEAETRWRTKKGATLDVWVRTVALVDEDGGSVRYRSAALDLTEKNRLANELRRRGDELQGANERLQTINTDLEEFTRFVSHDLKEPLRTLQSYSNLLAEEYSVQLGTDGFQYINHLIRASRRLERLIDDLLDLSKAGRITRSAVDFDLIEAVAPARNDLSDLIQRKQATVLTEGSLPRVQGDRDRITQLLTNLIANGLKYNQSPQPEVRITAAMARDNPREVIVSVRDNGIGIDPAFHDEIFRIHRRLHRSEEYEGTGFGLAICKKIVEGHGGRIWVESTPGQGATFFFTLAGTPAPVAQPVGRRTDSDGPPSRPRAARLPGSAGRRIVLVEDDPDTAHIIERQGRKAGLSVTWFPSAEEAWEHLQKHQPDFLLFDIRLPGMTGIDLCRKVRTMPAHHDTPIALFQSDQDPETLRAAGANFLLSKDLLKTPAVWQQRLSELLDQSRRPPPG